MLFRFSFTLTIEVLVFLGRTSGLEIEASVEVVAVEVEILKV